MVPLVPGVPVAVSATVASALFVASDGMFNVVVSALATVGV